MKKLKISLLFLSIILFFIVGCGDKCNNGDCRNNCTNFNVKIRFVDTIINQDITNDSGYTIILSGGQEFRIYDKDSFQYKIVSNKMHTSIENLIITKESTNIYTVPNVLLDINDIAKIYYYYNSNLFDSIKLFTVNGELQFDNHNNKLSVVYDYNQCEKLFALKK